MNVEICTHTELGYVVTATNIAGHESLGRETTQAFAFQVVGSRTNKGPTCGRPTCCSPGKVGFNFEIISSLRL